MSPKSTPNDKPIATADDTAGKSQAQLDKEAVAKTTQDDRKDGAEKIETLEQEAEAEQRKADSLATQAQAKKQEVSVAGSPVTNGTKSSTDASGAAAATAGNFSPTTVAPGIATAAPSDGPDGNPVRDPAAAEKRAETTAEATAEIVASNHPNTDEVGEPETLDDAIADKLDAENGFTTGADLATGADADNNQQDALVNDAVGDADNQIYRGGAIRIKKLVDLLDGKKDEFTIYGYGGAEIKLGDLRHVLTLYKD